MADFDSKAVELKMKISNLRPGCIEAMEATFALCDAINGYGLTLNDLTEVCRWAIDDGHDMAQIDLAMMAMAIARAKEEASKFLMEEQPVSVREDEIDQSQPQGDLDAELTTAIELDDYRDEKREKELEARNNP